MWHAIEGELTCKPDLPSSSKRSCTCHPHMTHLRLPAVWNGHLDNPKFMLFVQSFLFTQLRKAPSQRAELWVWRTQGVNNSLPSLNGGLDIPYTHPSLAALPYTLQCKHGLKFK